MRTKPEKLARLPRRVALALLVSFPAFQHSGDVAFAQETEEAQTALATVTVSKATTREMRAVVPVDGTVFPKQKILITPELDGLQVRQVLVDLGDEVKAGDILVRLKPARIEAELSQAQANVAQARSSVKQAESKIASATATETRVETDLERVATLAESGSVSKASYDEALAAAEESRAALQSARDGLAIAKAQLAVAESQLGEAELHLSQTDITSPVYGVVGARDADVGAVTAMAGQPLLTLYENGTMELWAEVIETALARIEPGDGGTIEVAGIGPLTGIVRLVSPTVDPTTRLGEVKITLEGSPELRSGLFGRGEIETERRQAVSVPITAILTDADGAYVQAVIDGVVRRTPVTPGLVWQDWREIVTGLDEGTTVISRAGAFFRDGDHVRTVATEADARP